MNRSLLVALGLRLLCAFAGAATEMIEIDRSAAVPGGRTVRVALLILVSLRAGAGSRDAHHNVGYVHSRERR
jgi:hypothetical protein